MKVLVIEDDPVVFQTLDLLLSRHNYAVDLAASSEAGLQMIEAFDYDLLMLDIPLPCLDGMHLCQTVRAKGIRTPILLLTGQGETQQKAMALNAGADDYVVKPFDTEELIARIQALLRRAGDMSLPILAWGDLAIDPSKSRVTYRSHTLTLTPKRYAILEMLLRNPHQVLSAKVIVDRVWPSAEYPGEESVRWHIKELRQQLVAAGAPKDFIETVHRVGYRLKPLAFSASEPPGSYLTAVAHAPGFPMSRALKGNLERLQQLQVQLQKKWLALDGVQPAIKQQSPTRGVESYLPAGWVATQTSELVAVQALLQDYQEQQQTLLEHSSEAIALLDENGYFLKANLATCKLLKVSSEMLQQANIVTFLASDSALAQVWQPLQPKEYRSGELYLRCLDSTLQIVRFIFIAHCVPHQRLLLLQAI
jgi:DNA-binding response OmpR family regulator